MRLKSEGWKVKIWKRERLEPPHATVLWKLKKWRFSLRTQAFMDDDPPASDLPPELVACIRENHGELCRQWDAMHPSNPIKSEDQDNE